MPPDYALKVPKKLRRVTLWVHPGSRVEGSLFLHVLTDSSPGGERPQDAMNTPEPFVVLLVERTGDPRFYNKRAILRMAYEDVDAQRLAEGLPILCRFVLLDHSVVEGTLYQDQPPSRSRLYDYLNGGGPPFVTIYQLESRVTLLNRDAILSAEELGTKPAANEDPGP